MNKQNSNRGLLSFPVAFKAFQRIADAWQLPVENRCQLLHVKRTSYNDWASGATEPEFSFDQLMTISKIVNIYDCLHRLFGDQTYADKWIRLENTAFEKKPPLALLLKGGTGIDRVFDLVMAALVGW